MGVARKRACWSLMPTTDTTAHRNPLLAVEASIHRMDAQVMSRVASNFLSTGLPISPPLSIAGCVLPAQPPTQQRRAASC
eukprot:3749366-Pleurochrysis_carterae.AAC.1